MLAAAATINKETTKTQLNRHITHRSTTGAAACAEATWICVVSGGCCRCQAAAAETNRKQPRLKLCFTKTRNKCCSLLNPRLGGCVTTSPSCQTKLCSTTRIYVEAAASLVSTQ